MLKRRNKRVKQDYSPNLDALQAVERFWLDFWCEPIPGQKKILDWIHAERLNLSNFVKEEKVLAQLFGEGHV